MKLKLSELVSLYNEINGSSKTTEDGKQEVLTVGILKQKMSLKKKMYIQRLNTLIAGDIKTYEESRMDIFRKHGEEKDGQIFVSAEKMPGFLKDSEDLMSGEVEINIKSIWGDDFSIDSLEDIETDECYPILFKLMENVDVKS